MRRLLNTESVELLKDAASGKIKHYEQSRACCWLRKDLEKKFFVIKRQVRKDGFRNIVVFRCKTNPELEQMASEAFEIYKHLKQYYLGHPLEALRRVRSE